ncbi:MAG: SusC/RagA family TonB-linked outer membrane protein [Chitinophagaceae bacterium]|nr:SusC/RagA family TonB-linked outer membrane protein [Chitinophagaceae bacterium]
MITAIMRVWLLACLLAVSLAGKSQEKIITGTVLSADDNSPLPGVSVTVKGKTGGTQTDESGTFSITATAGDVLVFSSTGYNTKEITAGNSAVINAALERTSDNLGEIVVVGYGTQSRRNITSSIAKLDNKVLANAPRANVGSALQGSVPGLQVVNSTGQPGAGPVLVLRGGASINNPGSPLVVIDGIIRSYNDIAVEDIASMELLKDAAATAIYGARANNGVVLITTKRGAAGKAQVSYKFTEGFNNRREGYKYLDTKDYIYYNRLGNLNSGRTLAEVNSSRGYGLLTDSANLSSFDIRRYDASTAYLMGYGWDTVGDPYGGTIIFKDHSGEVENLVFRNTKTQEHYINVAGGNDKGKYFSSFDYYKEDGVIIGSQYRRFSGNINGSYKISPAIEISSGATLSTSSQIGVNGSTVNNMYRNLSLWPTFNPWIDSAKTLPNPGNGINDGNPVYWLGKQSISNEVNRITANASVKWDILPSLYIKASGNIYLFEQLDQSFTKATQTYSNIFSNPQTYSNTNRTAYSTFVRDFQQQYNGIINYTKTFAEKHDVNAMLGTEYFGITSFAQRVLGTKAPTDDIPTVNASTTFAAGDNYSNGSEYRIISAFGRLNYAYDNRYLFTLVFREDGVSSLAKENRWGFFPGMSAGWNMHREAFFKNSGISHVISTLKPRISYGVNGNVGGLGRYEVQGGYSLQGLYSNNAGFLNTGIVNTNLHWEKSKTTGIGADIGFLQNRITLIFDYYNRKTSDLLTNLSLPSYTGFNTVRTNLGTLQNKGYEFAVNADLLKNTQGVSLSVSANASYVKNKILQLPYNGNENNRQGGLQIYNPKTGLVEWVGGLQEGQPMGSIYAFKQLGIFSSEEEIAKDAGNRVDLVAGISGPNSNYGSGKITPGDVNWMDIDKNDTIDSRDQVYVGNIYPKWTGGFSTNLSYKGFTLYSRFDFALGHTIYNDGVSRILGNYQGTFNYIDWMKNSWTPTNTNTDIPKVYYADQVSAPLGKKNYIRNPNDALNSHNSRFYEKGDYLACREITLSYDIPKTILSRSKVLSQSRVYVSMLNMFYITKFSGPTPEPPVSEGTSTITGVYAGTYPTPKTIVLGLQITF